MWIIFHAIFWDGNAVTEQDVVDSLLSPGVRIELRGNTTEDDDTSRLSRTSQDNVFPVYPVHENHQQAYSHKDQYQTQFVNQYSNKHDSNRRVSQAQDRISFDSVDTLIDVSKSCTIDSIILKYSSLVD